MDILVISEAPPTGAQLANITGLSHGAITGLIDRLEKHGYVIRDRDPVGSLPGVCKAYSV